MQRSNPLPINGRLLGKRKTHCRESWRGAKNSWICFSKSWLAGEKDAGESGSLAGPTVLALGCLVLVAQLDARMGRLQPPVTQVWCGHGCRVYYTRCQIQTFHGHFREPLRKKIRKPIYLKVIKLIRYHLPPIVKHVLAPQNDFGMAKITWSNHKSFGIEENPPPPPVWEKLPNNTVSFF